MSSRGWSRGAFVLLCAAIVLWVLAVSLPTTVLVLVGGLPGTDPDRTARGVAIALGEFVAFALPATAVTVVLTVRRRLSVRAGRPAAGPGPDAGRR